MKITVHYGRFIIINYVSEHQLFHIVNTSHTMPTTHVNRDLMLLKLIERDIIYILGGFRTYPKPRSRYLALNQAIPLGNK